MWKKLSAFLAVCMLSVFAHANPNNFSAYPLLVPSGASNILNVNFEINNLSQVVGETTTKGVPSEEIATVWTGQKPTQLLFPGTTFENAASINDAGLTAGTITTTSGTNYAFRDGPGGLQILHGINNSSSGASAINNSGMVVGDTETLNTSTGTDVARDTAWANSSPINLDVNALSASVATAVSNSGVVVGYCQDFSNPSVYSQIAFSWKSGKTTYLLNLGSAKDSEALAVNHSGVAGGYSENNSGKVHGVEWDAAGKIHDLGSLTSGGWSTVTDLNDSGEAVGAASDASGDEVAVLFADNQILELNSFLPSSFGYHLTDALSINDNDQIVAEGYDGENFGVFVLTPDPTAFIIAQIGAVPEPASIGAILFGVAVASRFCRRRSVR
jgi:hypothetical protein